MIRSYDYAGHIAAGDQEERGLLHGLPVEVVQRWASWWTASASEAFLSGYVHGAVALGVVDPGAVSDALRLLDVHLVEKALYELRYELANRPDWVHVPLLGLSDVIAGATAST